MDRIKYFKWILFREMTATRGQHIANSNICRDYVDDCFKKNAVQFCSLTEICVKTEWVVRVYQSEKIRVKRRSISSLYIKNTAQQ